MKKIKYGRYLVLLNDKRNDGQIMDQLLKSQAVSSSPEGVPVRFSSPRETSIANGFVTGGFTPLILNSSFHSSSTVILYLPLNYALPASFAKLKNVPDTELSL